MFIWDTWKCYIGDKDFGIVNVFKTKVSEKVHLVIEGKD